MVSSDAADPRQATNAAASLLLIDPTRECLARHWQAFFKTKSVPELSAVTQKWPELSPSFADVADKFARF
jgi:hypothetical protein